MENSMFAIPCVLIAVVMIIAGWGFTELTDPTERKFGTLLVCFLGIALGAILGSNCFASFETDQLKDRAIKAGVGNFYIKDHRRIFVFKGEPEGEL